jgi:hypothetical protein
MAIFACIENNIVVNTIVIDDQDILVNEQVSEIAGKEFISNLGIPGNWMLTSNDIRNKTASIGDIYNEDDDIFVIDESMMELFSVPWQGILIPESPSILFDAAVRSSNQFTTTAINQMFPDAFKRWGYLTQHNPKSFLKGIQNFDLMVTVVRNPIDSIASDIVVSKSNSEDEIRACFNRCLDMLKEINKYKNDICIFKFEEIINNPGIIGSEISLRLNYPALEYDEQKVYEALDKLPKIDYYPTPINNSELLNNAKNEINNTYSDLLNECNIVYNEVINNG